MPPPPVAVAWSSAGWGMLAAELVLVFLAAWAGGTSVAILRLGHRRMQVLLSFTGGILLGVAFLHLMPHAIAARAGAVDEVVPWMLAGFFLMFLLERAFRGHAHHAVDPDHGPAHGCDHSGGHHHAHAGAPASAGWGWCGALAGLAVHSLADGAALAASAESGSGSAGILAGFTTFLAILLHKPIDAALIAALMLNSGTTPSLRRWVNLVHAALVPLGAAAFVLLAGIAGDARSELLGTALAVSAGAFVCIAAADLLPEVEFHSHDRVLLSATLALGITLAAGISRVERHFRSVARAAAGAVTSGETPPPPPRAPAPDGSPAPPPAPPR